QQAWNRRSGSILEQARPAVYAGAAEAVRRHALRPSPLSPPPVRPSRRGRQSASMDVQPLRPGAPGPRQGPRRRDRRGRGRRCDLIPPHLPGYRSRRERFDDLVADAGAALAERFPRRLAHLQVLVEEVPSADPAPWEEPSVILGRVIPPSREHPARVIVYRRPLQTRCEDETELETLVRQVLSEQIGSLLGIAPEDVDPEAWAA